MKKISTFVFRRRKMQTANWTRLMSSKGIPSFTQLSFTNINSIMEYSLLVSSYILSLTKRPGNRLSICCLPVLPAELPISDRPPSCYLAKRADYLRSKVVMCYVTCPWYCIQLSHKVEKIFEDYEGLKFSLRTIVAWPIGDRFNFIPRRQRRQSQDRITDRAADQIMNRIKKENFKIQDWKFQTVFLSKLH